MFKPEVGVARCCFTEMHHDELYYQEADFPFGLRSHLQIFGPIAIGIKNTDSTGRLLGFNPVPYYYRRNSSSASDVDISLLESTIDSLYQIRNSLVTLAHVEAQAGTDDDRIELVSGDKLDSLGVGFLFESKDNLRRINEALYKLDTPIAQQQIGVFQNFRYPFWYLTQQLNLLLTMFQDADSQQHEDKRHLAYYRQREWRLLWYFDECRRLYPLSEKKSLDLELHDECIDILDEYRSFWTLNKSSHFTPKEVDWLYFQCKEEHIRTFISEIVVPAPIHLEVSSMIENFAAVGLFGTTPPTIKSYIPEEAFK